MKAGQMRSDLRHRRGESNRKELPPGRRRGTRPHLNARAALLAPVAATGDHDGHRIPDAAARMLGHLPQRQPTMCKLCLGPMPSEYHRPIDLQSRLK